MKKAVLKPAKVVKKTTAKKESPPITDQVLRRVLKSNIKNRKQNEFLLLRIFEDVKEIRRLGESLDKRALLMSSAVENSANITKDVDQQRRLLLGHVGKISPWQVVYEKTKGIKKLSSVNALAKECLKIAQG